ncbi:MAG TPA: pyridoxamine 5'-phosphate oxidase family protein [Albitalea sp.]|nr:pyridoxamine 5'-phosphate oxidase family protein [Albitalea sp.]
MPSPIGPEQAALIGRRVSIIVASRDASLRPHLMRAMGCRLSGDLRTVTLFMARTSSQAVLDDLRANGLIAVVFSEPSTNRTVQLKGGDACVVPTAPGDEVLVQSYIQRHAEEIKGIGFGGNVSHALFKHDAADLVAVRFTPTAAFEQTPGPKAGEALRASAG